LSSNRRNMLLALVICIALSFLSIVPLIQFASGFSEKLSEYYVLYDAVGLYDEINKFNVVAMIRIFILVVAIIYLKNNGTNKKINLHISLFAFPLFVYYGAASFPLMGGRLYELFGVFQVFLLSNAIQQRMKVLILLACFAIVLQFYVLIFHVRFVDFFYFFGSPYNIETTHKR
jgi:hypothetical protein